MNITEAKSGKYFLRTITQNLWSSEEPRLHLKLYWNLVMYKSLPYESGFEGMKESEGGTEARHQACLESLQRGQEAFGELTALVAVETQ